MASSHQVKRFFGAFSWPRIWLFRKLLQQFFLWRLKLEQPDLVVLGLDTMVMDNSEAEKRHGVEPTYKRGIRGFKPLQLSWGPYVIDAVFRGGKKHCNHGETAIKMLTRVAERIRKSYREDVPILIRADGAFFDQKIFQALEARGLFYVIGGRLDEATKAMARRIDPARWDVYRGARKAWAFREVWRCLGSWDRYRRAIYTYTWAEDGQRLLPFDTEQILYTNLGPGAHFRSAAEEAALAPQFDTCGLIKLYHDRGCDDLVPRALKDFRDERLPFKRFAMNAAFYYVMLVAFFLFEAFKRDVTGEVVPVESYATRLRRRVLDVAGKLVRHAHRITLKVTKAVWHGLRYGRLWERANAPPVFSWS
jgi:hypothetical protein